MNRKLHSACTVLGQGHGNVELTCFHGTVGRVDNFPIPIISSRPVHASCLPIGCRRRCRSLCRLGLTGLHAQPACAVIYIAKAD